MLQKIAKSENLVENTNARTFYVGKSYMLLPKHKRVIGWKGGPSSPTEERLQLISIYDRHVLS